MTKPKDGNGLLTLEQLYKALHYNPLTGEFTWKISRGGLQRGIGSIAGCLKPSGYILIDLDGIRYRSHRLAWFYMTGEWPPCQIDHHNTIRSDNRWCNLRLADNQKNQANSRISKNNSCGYKGVHFYNKSGRWKAKVNFNGKQIHAGTYDTPYEASLGYERVAKLYFGDYARRE